MCFTCKDNEENDGVYVLIRVFVAPPNETTLLVVHHGEASITQDTTRMYSIQANQSFDIIQMTSEASVDFMCYMQNQYVKDKHIQGYVGVDPLCKNVHDMNLRAMQSKATYGTTGKREITTSVLIMKGLSKQRPSSRSTNSNSSRRSSQTTQLGGR